MGAQTGGLRQPPATFGAFRHRHFRIFFAGYVVSLVGVWMQRVALAWLVLDLTDSAFYVGLVEALGTAPVLVFSLYAGALADRVSRYRMVRATQTFAMLLGFALAALVLLGSESVAGILTVATLIGVVTAFDIPARHAFFYDLVGKEDLTNAIALNASAFNATRIVGPAIAGVLIGVFGVGVCFLLNGVSYVAVLVALIAIRAADRPGALPARGTWNHIAEGVQYVRTEPRVRMILLNIAVFSVFGLATLVLVPVLARDVLGVGAREYGWMMSAVGVGAMIGALVIATFARHLRRGLLLGWATAAFGVLAWAAAQVQALWLVLGVMVLLGLAMITTTALTNTLLQTIAPDALRARVVSAYTVAFIGLAPLGALVMGVLAERFDVRMALSVGGIATVVAAVFGVVRDKRVRETA